MILDIFQHRLDVVSRALMQNDFDSYMAVMDMPFVLLSENGIVVMKSEEQIRFAFDIFVNFLQAEKATDLMRLAESVSAYSPGLITGKYETQVLRGGNRMYGPYSSTSSLRLVGDDWKIASIVSPEQGERWPTRSIQFK